MTTTTAPKAASARERLLAAADELFYGDGVHTVGIDKVIERAGVAKASLYTAFGSKEELIRAYLLRRYDSRNAKVMRWVDAAGTPLEKLDAVFAYLEHLTADEGFRGCPFVNASVESAPESAAVQVSDQARAWVRDLLEGLCREASLAEPENLARRLHLLYSGAVVSARMDHDPLAGTAAREVAAGLISAAKR